MYTSTGAICVLEMAVKAKEMWHSRGLEEESWVVVRDVLACKSVDKVEKNSLEFETRSLFYEPRYQRTVLVSSRVRFPKQNNTWSRKSFVRKKGRN